MKNLCNMPTFVRRPCNFVLLFHSSCWWPTAKWYIYIKTDDGSFHLPVLFSNFLRRQPTLYDKPSIIFFWGRPSAFRTLWFQVYLKLSLFTLHRFWLLLLSFSHSLLIWLLLSSSMTKLHSSLWSHRRRWLRLIPTHPVWMVPAFSWVY